MIALTNARVWQIAMEQSALDLGCLAEDFCKARNVIVSPFELGPQNRAYYESPIACTLVSYGNNIVGATQEEYAHVVTQYVDRFESIHCFETPNLHWLDDHLASFGQKSCFMAEYFLPDLPSLRPRDCGLETRLMGPTDFQSLYVPDWSNALCEKRKELDVLGVGAYENGRLVGLAACSADCAAMWQIGVDVLASHRHRGIASALTARLAIEVLERGKVPFYCCAWSNLASARNAIRSGFVPAWSELTCKPVAVIEKMNC